MIAAPLARLRAAWLRVRWPGLKTSTGNDYMQALRAEILRGEGDLLALRALAHSCPVTAEMLRAKSTLAFLDAERIEGRLSTSPSSRAGASRA